MPRHSIADRTFTAVNAGVLILIGLSMVYPLWYCLVLSISDPAHAGAGGFHLLPSGINLDAYRAILTDPGLTHGYLNSLLRVLIAVPLSVFASALCAYPLSRRNLPCRSGFTVAIIFTMLFSGGLVPTYLLYHQLGLLDNRLVYLLPGLIGAFNVILIKNHFQAIPESLHEAGEMDGASEWFIFFHVYLPLAKPILATVALFNAIFHWNAWFDAMLYMTSESKMVAQSFLQRIVFEGSAEMAQSGAAERLAYVTPGSIKAATVIITVVPLLLIYPFVQRHFTKGIMLGGVKG